MGKPEHESEKIQSIRAHNQIISEYKIETEYGYRIKTHEILPPRNTMQLNKDRMWNKIE